MEPAFRSTSDSPSQMTTRFISLKWKKETLVGTSVRRLTVAIIETKVLSLLLFLVSATEFVAVEMLGFVPPQNFKSQIHHWLPSLLKWMMPYLLWFRTGLGENNGCNWFLDKRSPNALSKCFFTPVHLHLLLFVGYGNSKGKTIKKVCWMNVVL